LKRTDDQRLAERLGIKLERRSAPKSPDGTLYAEPWRSYSFVFTPLMRITKHTKRCRPGVSFYGSSFGATSDAAAWKRALEQFSLAIRPSARAESLLTR